MLKYGLLVVNSRHGHSGARRFRFGLIQIFGIMLIGPIRVLLNIGSGSVSFEFGLDWSVTNV